MNNKSEKSLGTLDHSQVTENPPGIFRSTLSFSEKIMLCHFAMKKGAQIPLHDHVAVQCGYVISGEVRFFKEDDSGFTATAGTSYVFASNEKHGADVVQDAKVVECFAPMRPEYA